MDPRISKSRWRKPILSPDQLRYLSGGIRRHGIGTSNLTAVQETAL
jgi:hypothetical protein